MGVCMEEVVCLCEFLGVGGERETETDRQIFRQAGRQTNRESERERGGGRGGDRDRDRERQRCLMSTSPMLVPGS